MFNKNTNQTIIREETYTCTAGDSDNSTDLVSVNVRSVNDYSPSVTLNLHVPGRKNPVAVPVDNATLASLRDMFTALCDDVS